ncbi:MAG: hypothetical protein BroJett040_14190 [Oligoflexia bacterium]|nr:MAG: hypothetical protein BroJett040_14190 [Oligoflexia bacterium]
MADKSKVVDLIFVFVFVFVFDFIDGFILALMRVDFFSFRDVLEDDNLRTTFFDFTTFFLAFATTVPLLFIIFFVKDIPFR